MFLDDEEDLRFDDDEEEKLETVEEQEETTIEEEKPEEEQELELQDAKAEEEESEEEFVDEEYYEDEEQDYVEEPVVEESEEDKRARLERSYEDTTFFIEKDSYANLERDPKKPLSYFSENKDGAFLDVTGVTKKRLREWNYFKKFRKYANVSSFIDRPEKATHLYEKWSWEFTLFDRVMSRFGRVFAKPMATGPFTTHGLYDTFEKQTLENPTSCPVYVLKSMELMEHNLKRFARITAVLQRDHFDDMDECEFPDETIVKIGSFLKKGYPRYGAEEQDVPTTQIDRNEIPACISPADIPNR